jgi:hypothetical protein
MAELTATADGTRLLMRVTSLDWVASVRALARRCTAAAGQAGGLDWC